MQAISHLGSHKISLSASSHSFSNLEIILQDPKRIDEIPVKPKRALDFENNSLSEARLLRFWEQIFLNFLLMCLQNVSPNDTRRKIPPKAPLVEFWGRFFEFIEQAVKEHNLFSPSR